MITLIAVLVLVLVLGALWGVSAMWFHSPFSGSMRALPSVAWGLFAVLALTNLAQDRPLTAWLFTIAVIALLCWWCLCVNPSNQGNWMPEVACLTHGLVKDNIVTLRNVRNFDWRSRDDYDVHWETRDCDLNQIKSVDLVLSYWGRPAIAHAMVSFGFSDGQYIVFSVEIRRKQGDKFSELGGFFRQYELLVLASTEEDSLRVRTNIRGEHGSMYRVQMPAGAARALFLSYIETANSLVHTPRFYNTVTANCTTIVYQLVRRIVPHLPIDYRLLLSGYLPEYLFALDALEGAESAEEYRRAGNYTDRAQAVQSLAHFSSEIRRGVPGIND